MFFVCLLIEKVGGSVNRGNWFDVGEYCVSMDFRKVSIVSLEVVYITKNFQWRLPSLEDFLEDLI